jgi:hypothetical protein
MSLECRCRSGGLLVRPCRKAADRCRHLIAWGRPAGPARRGEAVAARPRRAQRANLDIPRPVRPLGYQAIRQECEHESSPCERLRTSIAKAVSGGFRNSLAWICVVRCNTRLRPTPGGIEIHSLEDARQRRGTAFGAIWSLASRSGLKTIADGPDPKGK